jgi:SAM-dependent methyltransferase
MMSEVGPATNAAQAERWNGASGHHWIENRERHLGEHRYLTPHLFRAAAIAPGDRVLDVGCGCGHTTIAAAQAGAAVGLDLSAPMLAEARRLAIEAGADRARFVQGDAQACPIQPRSCDILISSFGVMFFDDPQAAFAGLAAAVRPGGRLAFMCWQDDKQNEVFALPLRVFGCHAQLPEPAADGLFVDPARIARLLSGTGWEDIEVASIQEDAWMGSDVGDVMRYVGSMPRIRAIADSLDDPALSERVLASVAEEYAARQRSDGIFVRAAAWIVTANRASAP